MAVAALGLGFKQKSVHEAEYAGSEVASEVVHITLHMPQLRKSQKVEAQQQAWPPSASGLLKNQAEAHAK